MTHDDNDEGGCFVASARNNMDIKATKAALFFIFLFILVSPSAVDGIALPLNRSKPLGDKPNYSSFSV